MTLLELIVLLVIAGITGSVAQTLVGFPAEAVLSLFL
jgi:type II secretory pathway pseudopilin PulG